jgi:hypothetical protein
MKKLFILFAAACLFSCSNTKDSNKTDDPEKPENDKKPKKELVKKSETEQKKDLQDLFDETKAEKVTSEDKRGWTEERKAEVTSFCMQDMQGVEEADAKTFCSCQLNNIMNAFPSYVEAMKLFNSMDEEEESNISDDQMEKVEKMMNANESCMEQLMKKYNEGYNEEEDYNEADESGRKKKNP